MRAKGLRFLPGVRPLSPSDPPATTTFFATTGIGTGARGGGAANETDGLVLAPSGLLVFSLTGLDAPTPTVMLAAVLAAVPAAVLVRLLVAAVGTGAAAGGVFSTAPSAPAVLSLAAAAGAASAGALAAVSGLVTALVSASNAAVGFGFSEPGTYALP